MNVQSSPDYDIAIVGGGLSGTLAAVTLGRAGWRVALIDRNEVYPPEFRVEKIGAEQMAKLAACSIVHARRITASCTRISSPRCVGRSRLRWTSSSAA